MFVDQIHRTWPYFVGHLFAFGSPFELMFARALETPIIRFMGWSFPRIVWRQPS